MKRNLRSQLLSSALVAMLCLPAFVQLTVMAQQPVTAQETKGAEPTIERDEAGRVRFQLPRNLRVALDNRTTGRITATGWDGDTVEATAKSEHGVEYVRTEIYTDESGAGILVKADYRRESDITSLFVSRPYEIHLEVKLPRHAQLELIRVYQSDVEISGLETPVVVHGRQSTIRLSRVGAVEVRTKSGPVDVDKATGLVDVITTSGPVRVREAAGDVRALSIGGRVEIECARGRVNVSSTDGPVHLSGIGGDVDVATTESEIRLTGAIRAGGRYHLKSMSGPIELAVQPNSAGFTATLSSYKGTIEPSFPLKITQSPKNEPTNRRLTGRHGDGQAQVTLDSFDGNVQLSRATQAPAVCP